MKVSACQRGPWRVDLFVTLSTAQALNFMDLPARKQDPCHV